METARLCKKYAGKGVVAIDIACSGDKDGEMLKDFAEAYQVRIKQQLVCVF